MRFTQALAAAAALGVLAFIVVSGRGPNPGNASAAGSRQPSDAPCVAARRAAERPGAGLVYSPARPDSLKAVTSATSAGKVGIGIDDGPDPRWTPAMLEVLERHGASATFFVVGDTVAANPGLLAQVAAAGHEVGLHSDDHAPLAGQRVDEVAARIEAGRRAVRAGGVEPAPLLRAPYGRQDPAAAEGACRAGVRTIGWSANVDRVHPGRGTLGSRLRPGAIVLAHDGRGNRAASVAALDQLLTEIGRRGLVGVGIGRLLVDAGVAPAAGPGAGR